MHQLVGSIFECRSLFSKILFVVFSTTIHVLYVVEVVIAPPALYLIPLKELVKPEIKVAAQNCYFKGSGAFTGEIRSAANFIYLVPLKYIDEWTHSICQVLLSSRTTVFPMSF